MAGLSSGDDVEQPIPSTAPTSPLTDRGFRPAERRRSAPMPPSRVPARLDDAVDAGVAAADGSLSLLDDSGSLVQLASPAVTESLRYMVGRLRLGEGGDLPDRLGITSAIRGEGTTFICRTLAMVLANDAAKRVCIVDLNWWSPSDWPGEDEQLGVADVLRDGCPLERVVEETGFPGLYVLPAGSMAPHERPALARSPDLEKMLVELSEDFDHVLVDLPAVHATSESLTLAESCRSLILVIGQGTTPDSQVSAALEELRGVTLLGVILNRSYSKIPRIIRKRIPGA
jgi:Mrp family chromosome partitioning ATPase